jgi:GT2 family glycosyltransferase
VVATSPRIDRIEPPAVAAPIPGDGIYAEHLVSQSSDGEARETKEKALPIEESLFSITAYLEANPDVAAAYEAGVITSVYQHYLLHGFREGRPLRVAKILPAQMMVHEYHADESKVAGSLACSVDALMASPTGGIFIVGWINDRSEPLKSLRVSGRGWHLDLDASELFRFRRKDVEESLNLRVPYDFGFCGLFHLSWKGELNASMQIDLGTRGGAEKRLEATARILSDVELRDDALGYLASTAFFGNPQVERMARVGRGFGPHAVALNRSITRQILVQPYIERFSETDKPRKGTIVVCLYGKPEFYFLQHALFSGCDGLEDYEFMYVCNSPEMSERLLREAHSAQRIYGISSTVAILSGNAGFGAANNLGVQHARSDRILIVNPDVFPRDTGWIAKHNALLRGLPQDQTRIFGSTLYYDDGSLMHGGMYFDSEISLSIGTDKPKATPMMRVEHYGKGAPPGSTRYAHSRPVPAVTGAFISIARPWFEKLGGFTEDFVFGHYEDADLCLKSLERGCPSWIHDLGLWHLEGKGSTRRLPHEGGSIVNRWLFAKNWTAFIEPQLLSPSPTHPLIPSTPRSAR